MSAYYEFQLAFNLKEDSPQPVIDVLAYMTGARQGEKPAPPDDHDFFRIVRWESLLTDLTSDEPNCGDAICSFRKVYQYTKQGVDHYQYTFHFRCLWHDDAFNHDWWLFTPWIAQYADANWCVGYFQDRHGGGHPTLIYFRNGMVYMRQVEEAPISLLVDGEPWPQ